MPNCEQAIIPPEKITGYLLSFSHRDGRGKAIFFAGFGFSTGTWRMLAAALNRHACENEVARIEHSPFGQRYVVEGPIFAPDGRTPTIRAIWFIETGEEIPRFVTAYPL